MRDFTPRHYDARARELWVDSFLHEAGPAASSGITGGRGSDTRSGGPKGSAVIALDGIDIHVLIGDETAVPAIARRLEELPAGTRAQVFVESDHGVQWLAFASKASVTVTWVPRDGRAWRASA